MVNVEEINLINQGGIAEQVVGQLLRTNFPFYKEPKLYYWTRNEPGTDAEIDYVIQQGTKVIPIEVKSGSSGCMKSLHLFMQAKHYSTAVRINSAAPILENVKMRGTGGLIEYNFLSIPFYLIGELPRLLAQVN